jgi:hypothetical protein
MSSRKKRNKTDSIETQTTPGMSPLIGPNNIPPFDLIPIEIGVQTEIIKEKEKDKDIEKEIEREIENDIYTEKDVEYLKHIKRKNPIILINLSNPKQF